MRTFRLILLITVCILFSTGCKGKIDDGGSDNQAWVHEKPLVSRVEVFCGDKLIETYQYTYDIQNRPVTLVKTDNLQGVELLNLTYSYDAAGGLKVLGKFYPLASNRFITATWDKDGRVLTYGGSWSGAWTYTTTVNDASTAVSTSAAEKFAASKGWYSSEVAYSEEYTEKAGCITKAVKGSSVKAQTKHVTHSESASTLTVNYTYGSDADRQNFAVYLFDCDFPVWYAAGLPGCKKLITGISCSAGDVPFDDETRLEYSLNPAGNIETVTRTDLNAGKTILVRTYKFTYL